MMPLFWNLVLAHMIADFLLQPNAVYNLKLKGVAGQILHGLIICLTLTIFLASYLGLPMIWTYLFIIGLTHVIQDLIKTKYFKDHPLPFWPFIIDEITHLLLLALIFIFPLPQGLKPPVNPIVSYFLIAYIFVTWQATYFIDTFIKTFLKNSRLHNLHGLYFVPAKEKYYGILERACFTAVCFSGGVFYLLLAPLAAARFLFKDLRSAAISILGIILSAVTALVLRMAINGA